MVSYSMAKKEIKVFIVIPTIRNLNFLENWGKAFSNCHLIIVEDRDKKTIKIPNLKAASVLYFNHQDIEKDLGKNSWIISRKNAGVRCFGFWKAYQMGADIIITIDDDCYPTESGFVEKHLDNLNFKLSTDWATTYPNPKWMYTRGIPYLVRNRLPTAISHGLWSGAIDLDAKTEIKLPRLLFLKPYPAIRQIIPRGYFFPMCSMNLAFKRKITPVMFFPMMGQKPDGRPWPYDRYDDIWAGLFSKKIMDHLGLGIVNGSPFIDHKKESKPKKNYQKELAGMKMNEILWKRVSEVKLTKTTPKTCYLELASKIKFPQNSYFQELKKAMVIWANLF